MSVGASEYDPQRTLGRERLLTVSDVCDLIQVAATFVYRHAPELGVIKVGSHLRFRQIDIDRWLEARRLPVPTRDCHNNVDNLITHNVGKPIVGRKRI